MIELVIHAVITLLVVLDPIGLAPIFAALAADRSDEEKKRIARLGVLVAAGVLFVFALLGKAALAAIGVSLAAFRVAGGILLLLVAIDMVFGRQLGLHSTTRKEDAEASQRPDIAVFPLGIPLIAGPGAIASVMLLMGDAEASLAREAAVLIVLGLSLGLTFVCLRASGRVVKLLGVIGVTVVGRVLGVVLASLAAQFIIDGLRAAFAG
ncbi:MAG TPA: MarC family protein [Alphaproteobacteria bacterium]|nr:MarC family protein [Alphaproteobacteria bacterium]